MKNFDYSKIDLFLKTIIKMLNVMIKNMNPNKLTKLKANEAEI